MDHTCPWALPSSVDLLPCVCMAFSLAGVGFRLRSCGPTHAAGPRGGWSGWNSTSFLSLFKDRERGAVVATENARRWLSKDPVCWPSELGEVSVSTLSVGAELTQMVASSVSRRQILKHKVIIYLKSQTSCCVCEQPQGLQCWGSGDEGGRGRVCGAWHRISTSEW